VVQALRAGQPLYLLPDMNITRQESVFVPFYGVSTATLTSLSRFASLGRAKVVPVITRMTEAGYEVQVLEAWDDFRRAICTADAATMNRLLQTYIDTMPTQYYWVHKRFKVRPAGEPPVLLTGCRCSRRGHRGAPAWQGASCGGCAHCHRRGKSSMPMAFGRREQHRVPPAGLQLGDRQVRLRPRRG
jgi:hypothetical protein